MRYNYKGKTRECEIKFRIARARGGEKQGRCSCKNADWKCSTFCRLGGGGNGVHFIISLSCKCFRVCVKYFVIKKPTSK